MDFSETRIGNYVYFKHRPNYSTDKFETCVIRGNINRDSAFVLDINKYNHTFTLFQNMLEFIPLTEEWLLKFGFKPFCKDFSLKGIVIHKRKRGWVLRKSVPDLKYVHQLQNLYFALKGEELNLKQI